MEVCSKLTAQETEACAKQRHKEWLDNLVMVQSFSLRVAVSDQSRIGSVKERIVHCG